MRNLAGGGDVDADLAIRDELSAAGIDIVPIDPSCCGEVSTHYAGRLGPFSFSRRWYYWRVTGTVPLAVAREMYAHADGALAVRVNGHCAAPPPDEDVDLYDIDTAAGLRLFAETIRKYGLDKQTTAEERERFCRDAERATIERVRTMVGARYDEATTDAVARALRREGSEG
jgi:hypothetical protein